jgi:MFS family permease
MLTQALMALQALLLAYLTLTNQIGVWTIFALALVLGVIGLFELTARQSFVVEMVGKEDLMNAIPLSSSMYNMGRVIGPSIAGALVVAIGEGWCFAVNGASFIAVIIGLWMMRLPARPPQTEEFAPVEQFREGLSHVLASKPIRELLANLGMLSFFCTTALMLMPVFADRELGGGPKTLGFLMTSFGGGALVGALLLASRPNLSGLSRRIVGSTLVYGFALVLFALAEWLPLACLLIACAGGGIMMQVAATNTALQSITPDRLRGRVVGYYGMMFLGMAPLGNLFAGWLADQIGVRWTVGLTSAVCVAIALHFNARRAVVADALRQAGQRAAA